jgi:hypothetical protein
MLRVLSFIGAPFISLYELLAALVGYDRKPAGPGASRQSRQNQPPSGSPYSDQYETIIRQGHTRPIPEVGAPALLWHVGIWPRKHLRSSDELCDPRDTHDMTYKKARSEYVSRRELWVKQVNGLVRKLQEADCRPRTISQPLKQFISSIPHRWLSITDAQAECIAPVRFRR